MPTTKGVRAADNSRQGKRAFKYDGHNATGHQTADRQTKWRKWRRRVAAGLRLRVREREEEL